MSEKQKKRKTIAYHAVLVLIDARKFTPKRAREVSRWLADKAAELRDASFREKLAGRFTARYMK